MHGENQRSYVSSASVTGEMEQCYSEVTFYRKISLRSSGGKACSAVDASSGLLLIHASKIHSTVTIPVGDVSCFVVDVFIVSFELGYVCKFTRLRILRQRVF